MFVRRSIKAAKQPVARAASSSSTRHALTTVVGSTQTTSAAWTSRHVAASSTTRRLFSSATTSSSRAGLAVLRELASSHGVHGSAWSRAGARAAAVVTAVSLFGGSVAFADAQPSAKDLARADAIYDNESGTHTRKELLEVMQQLNRDYPEQPDVMWRLSRAYYEMFKLKSTPKEQGLEYLETAYRTIKSALQLAPDNYKVQMWLGITLSKFSGTKGTKATIQQSYNVRAAFEKSAELGPDDDATPEHLIGMWCFEVAKLSWLELKVAETLFAKPPTSTYDEALKHFLASESKDPGSYKANQVMIAKCYELLGDKDNARKWYDSAMKLPNNTEEDEDYHQQATAGLKKVL